MLASRKRPLPLLAVLTLFIVGLFYHKHAYRIAQNWSQPSRARLSTLPANRTLGFGAVIAVSREGSERRHSLLQAANVTDFDIVIPKQPEWTEGDIQTFINGQDTVQKGSLLAWLAHGNALKWFLDSGLETALILEDDVDWDIRLRSIQVPLAAAAARQLFPPAKSPNRFANFRSNHRQFWGNPNAWDLLYLGHCGDYFDVVTADGPNLRGSQSFNLSAMPHTLYQDPTLPLRQDLHPFTHKLFDALGIPDHSRALHPSKFPLCSFGYAVTRFAAERLLNELAAPKLRKGGPRAFDVALLHACHKGPSDPSSQDNDDHDATSSPPKPGFRCWTLNSELFHHMPGQSEIDHISKMMGGQPGVPPVDRAGQEQVINRNETTNIGCGFWGGAFSFDDNDLKRLQYLQDHVGRQGQCLKEGRRQVNHLNKTAVF